MVEQTIRGGGGAPVQEPVKSISEQILAAGGDLKDKAGEFAGASISYRLEEEKKACFGGSWKW